MDLTHLLLTRFNAAVNYAPDPKRLETDWLMNRLRLFEQYRLPSVVSQADAQFHWIVFFDVASPRWFKEKIESYGSLIHPIYIGGVCTDQMIQDGAAATGLVSTPYVVTTRLDNDDALARNHLALVQQSFDRQEREFIEFPNGLQSFRGHLYTFHMLANPFLSLIERVYSRNRFTTVFCIDHTRVREMGRVKTIRTRSPQWLMVLHDGNVGNQLYGWPRLVSRSHPHFDVVWPPLQAGDSLAMRWKYTAESYGVRAGGFLKRVVHRFSSYPPHNAT